ncbi:hypothetical protein EDB83DRAFT_2411651 [Lactarius deliciosus]|nr:hypothetical protein EDB83DRAFT_2411651 [Lactarius deliciosus]
MDFSKSIYWCGVPAVRACSLAPASLRLVHDTLAITLSLSHPRSDVHILPVVRGSPTGLRSVPPRPHTLRVTPPLALGLHRPSFRVPPSRHTPRGGGWAGRTDPLASPGVRRRGGERKHRAGVARVEGADALTLPLACTGGGGPDWHGLRRAGRGAVRGIGLVSPAPRRAELCAPSLPLRAWAGRGWTHHPSSCGGARGVGLTWPTRRGGRTVPPLANAGGTGRVGLGRRRLR